MALAPILILLLVIAVLGLIVWAITTYIPMPPPFKIAILIVGAVFAVLITLNAFGLLGAMSAPVIVGPGHR